MNKNFSKRLKSARVMRNLSMKDLSELMGSEISPTSISKYERGLMMPTSQNLIGLANALSVKVDYFFKSFDLTLEKIEYRKKSALGRNKQAAIEEEIKDYAERFIELITILDIADRYHPSINAYKVDSVDDIDKATNSLRDDWELGKDPILSVVDLLEEKGFILIEISDAEGFDGLSANINGYKVIAYNGDYPADRKRLTILHELAHMLLDLDHLVKGEREKICHKFAGSFLMQADSFKKEFIRERKNFTVEELVSLKEYFGASVQAIVYRAFDLKLIDEYHKTNFFISWNKMGYRVEEPGDYKINEKPSKLDHLVQMAVAEEIISLSKAAALLDMSLDEIKRHVKVV